jgi:MFS family permease
MGAGGIITLIMIAFGQLFAPEVRGKAQGLVSMVWGISSLVGPLAGGLIVEHFAWQWIFLINLPVGLVAAGVIYFALPRHLQERKPHRIEVGAALLLVAGLVTTMVALSNADSPWLLLLPLGISSLAVFCWQQARSPEPIIPMSMFANPVYAVGGTLGFLASFTMFAALSYVPLFAQGVLGRSPAEAGVVLTPMMFAWPVAAASAGVLVNRLGFRKLVLFGSLSMLVGFCLLSVLGADTPLYPLIAGATLLGAGMGVNTSTCLVAIQVSVPRTQLGAASATLALMRNVGAAFGLSLLGGLQLYWMTVGIRDRAGALTMEQADLLADPSHVLHQVGASHWPAPVAEVLRLSLYESLHGIFVASIAIAAVCLVLAWRMPALTPVTAAEKREARGN